MSAFNCSKIFVAAFNLQGIKANSYFESIVNSLSNNLPSSWSQSDLQQKLILVSSQKLAQQVLGNKDSVGVCLAQAGMLESSSLNQIQGVRAALVHNQYIAEMCRLHNDANIIVLSTDCLGEKLVGELVLNYLNSSFDNEERNMIRIQMMKELGEKYLK